MIVKKNFRYILGGTLVFLLGGRRILHFLVQETPLGYDPGWYKVFFDSIASFDGHRDFSLLPNWMKSIFPPFLGMLVDLIQGFLGISADSLITWGAVLQSLLIPIGIRYMLRSLSPKAAIIAAGLTRISFLQYEIFRRNYLKQLLGMFFLLMMIGGYLRGYKALPAVLLAALFLTHRPAFLYAGVVVLLVLGAERFRKTGARNTKMSLILVGAALFFLLISRPIYADLILYQYPQLLSQFISSRDLPNYNDSFQAGGTFLTTSEFFKTNRLIFLLSLGGCVITWNDNSKQARILRGLYLFSVFWILGQMSFYQRMMGYADLFFLSFAALFLIELVRNYKSAWILIVAVFLYQGASFAYRVERTRRPIIEQEEFQKIKELDELLPPVATIMSTSSTYSTRLQYAHRPLIAPGLFELDKRDRTKREDRWESNGDQKCKALVEDYGNLAGNLYIRQGSKQLPLNLGEGKCFGLFEKGEKKLNREIRKFIGDQNK